jgi:DEAD/DEAH box helicase domain-containing protein
LQEILNNPAGAARFSCTDKALAADQYAIRAIWHCSAKNRIQAGVYDGRHPGERTEPIRNNANIILTNPDMLNTAFLAHHASTGSTSSSPTSRMS